MQFFFRASCTNRLRLKESKDGVQGCSLVMLGKVRGLEREKHRFESRGFLSLQINIHLLLVLCLLYLYLCPVILIENIIMNSNPVGRSY
jgi:hypothetical protein